MEDSVLGYPSIRPRSITLLLVDEDQVENLIKIVGTFRREYDGALLLCCNLSQALVEEAQQRIRGASELGLRRVERSMSLSPGKLYWLKTDLNYGINATEQIYRLNPNATSTPNLLNHLKRNFPERSRVLLLGQTFIKQLVKPSYLTDIKVSLLTTSEIVQQNPLLTGTIESHFSVEVYDDPNSLAVAANVPIPRMNRPVEREVSADSEAFQQIINLLKGHKNVDFSLYKEASLLDRIDQRMHRKGLFDLADYAHRLRIDSIELDALYAHLFVGMTSFFRDTGSFLELYHYLEEYLSQKPIKSLRIWSAGCSTGAEAYSVALICDRLRRSSEPNLTAEVIGTDLNPKAIELATQGKFTSAQLAQIPSEFLPEKLIGSTKPVELCEELTTAVRFQRHNLLGNESLGQFDLILCRNVFIYLSTQTQTQVLVNFHKALNPGGMLMLGRSERAGERSHYFVAKSERAKIYRAVQLSPSS